MTVQELTSIIGQESIYITPSKLAIVDPRLSTSIYLSSIQDFQDIVREGNLYVQCSGAAQFLRFSLEEVFGKGTAATTNGYRLSRRTVSTTAWHKQTVFTYEGQVYLLDATPSSTEGTSYSDYLFEDMQIQLKHPVSPLAVSKTIKIGSQTMKAAESVPEPSQLREQKIQAVRQTLDAQLMGLLQAPDRDAVYEKINVLHRDDPFRVTVETTLRATYGEVTREEAERLNKYLVAYQEADDILRRQMRVPSYDEQTVQLLQGTAKQLLDQL